MTQTPSPEAVERMVALVLKLLKHTGDCGSSYLGDNANTAQDLEMLAEARAIAAMLPKPVDPAVLAIREIMAKSYEDDPHASLWLTGEYDTSAQAERMLAAYHAGQSHPTTEGE